MIHRLVRGEDLASRPWLERLAFIPTEATTPGRWVDSCDVRVGDEVLLRDGRTVTVERIAIGSFEGTVYNMQVEGLQCYTVGENCVLVHNNSGAGKGSRSGSGKNEPHGRSPGTKLMEQVQKLEEELTELNRTQGSARRKAEIRKTIINLNKKMDKIFKGETHHMRR